MSGNSTCCTCTSATGPPAEGRTAAALPELLGLLGGLHPRRPGAAARRRARRCAGRRCGTSAGTPPGSPRLIRVRALALYGVDCAIGVGRQPACWPGWRRARPGPGRPWWSPEEPTPCRVPGRQPVAALHGVGPATARTLCAYGLDTVGRVAAAPLADPAADRSARRPAASCTSGRAASTATPVVPNAAAALASPPNGPFDRDELDPDRHRRALLSLAEELGFRHASDGQVCRALTLTVRYADRSTTTRTRTLAEPTAHTPVLTATAYALHDALGLQRARVRAVSLRAEDLTPAERAARQLTFDPADDKARRAEEVADRARLRFGAAAAHPAALFDAA